MKTLSERFDEKWVPVTESGCWLWTASTSNGYGFIKVDGKMSYAHRVSYELYNGDIPDGDGYHGICVLHRCDVRSCVNPAHLFIGTHQDNMDDRERKGRNKIMYGEKHGSSKLSPKDVMEIRHKQSIGEKQSDLANEYDVKKATISLIVNRKLWKHI